MAENRVSNQLFTEMFRPRTIAECILCPRVRQELEKGVHNSILMYGTAGIGKTSLTRLLVQGHDVLEINASLERGIDTIRDEVVAFASTSSIITGEDTFKIIQLEECDNLTLDAWKSLRSVMEKYYKNVRFVANCNYVEKIPEPIQSRFNMICLNPINQEESEFLFKEYVSRVGYILSKMNIKFTEDTLKEFVKKSFPDMRYIVKNIQQMHVRKVTELSSDMLKASYDCSPLFQMILSAPNPWDNYKNLSNEWGNNPESAIINIAENFVSFVHDSNMGYDSKIPELIITIAEHQNMLSTAIDKFIVLASLVFKLQLIINRS